MHGPDPFQPLSHPGEGSEVGENSPDTAPAAARERPKRPESILVVVATRAGEVLMLRRTQPPDFWQSVTGSLRWGETARPAALRELWEETGIQAGAALLDLRHSVEFPILPAWRHRYAPTARANLEHWFALWLPGRRLLRLDPDEHLEHRWLPWPRAAQLASSWTNREAILRLYQGPAVPLPV